jgi:hypothetical protein
MALTNGVLCWIWNGEDLIVIYRTIDTFVS